MMKSARMVVSCLVVVSALVGVTGCSRGEKEKAKAENLPTSALPDSYWMKSAPEGAKPVAEVREKAKTGDTVVVTGRVGGAKEPFANGAAAFTIVDASIPPCKDECESPWDYCCEPQDKLTKNTVTVEFREKDAVVKMPARGFHGLDHLKNVVVTGEAKRDEAGNVVVVAKGIFISN